MTTTTTTPKKRVRNPRPLPPPLRDDVQRVERKVDALSAALAQLASAQATLLEATATLAGTIAARPPAVASGASSHHTAYNRSIYLTPPVLEETLAFTPRRAVPRFEDPPSPVPRGTAQAVTDPVTNAPEPPLRVPSDFADMAHELADLAEEDEAPPPPPDEYEVWERRVAIYHGQRLWRETWGPRPGQDGCLCPPELLRGRGR